MVHVLSNKINYVKSILHDCIGLLSETNGGTPPLNLDCGSAPERNVTVSQEHIPGLYIQHLNYRTLPVDFDLLARVSVLKD